MVKFINFDSIYLLGPIRLLYLFIVKRLLHRGEHKSLEIILSRLDKDNIFLGDNRNLSALSTDTHKDDVEVLSLKFYKYLVSSGNVDGLKINNIPLHYLYTRQIKLKLGHVIRCALKLKKLSLESSQGFHIITDKQTSSIMKAAFLFLEFDSDKIFWKINKSLTFCVTLNAIIMRFFALIRMYFSSSKLPKEYFFKCSDPSLPTILYILTKVKPEELYQTYIQTLEPKFNILLYNPGPSDFTPKDFSKIKFKTTISLLRGFFGHKYLFLNEDSYLADIILVFRDHADLIKSVDVVNSLYSNRIDIHISKQQTNALEAYVAQEAKKRGIFVLADVMEEVFHCDSAICPSAMDDTQSLRMALTDSKKIVYKGGSSLIDYRLKMSNKTRDENYIQDLIGIDKKRKVIFYASDPSKEESQKYATEKFLIDCFSSLNDFILVIKTHPEDTGRVTNLAFMDSSKPSNVFLIGDTQRGRKMVSENFLTFKDFDFFAAIESSEGFLTYSSSSILEALALDKKTGIVDIFHNGYYDYLVDHKVSMRVKDEIDLNKFLTNQKLTPSEESLSYLGSKDDNVGFDLGSYVIDCIKFNENKSLKNS